MAAYPYTCATAEYTVEQIEGEACSRCGRSFRVGEASRPFERVNGQQIFAHILCPKRGAR